MREIALPNGKATIVDDDAPSDVFSVKWYLHSRGYVCRTTHGKTIMMHRIISGARPGQVVDHVNNNPLDNRRSNLRACYQVENTWNCPPVKNKLRGRLKGVSWSKKAKKWEARIRVYGKLLFLGYYGTEEEGARAYDSAAISHFGEFAWLNFGRAR